MDLRGFHLPTPKVPPEMRRICRLLVARSVIRLAMTLVLEPSVNYERGGLRGGREGAKDLLEKLCQPLAESLVEEIASLARLPKNEQAVEQLINSMPNRIAMVWGE